MTESESHAYWSGRAEEFSGLRMRDYASPLRPAYCAYLARYAPAGPIRVLDAGAGAGLFAVWMAELGWRVTGIDFSADMLAQARKNADRLGHPEIELAAGDVQALPFEDGAFDMVVTHNVLWVVTDAAAAYREMLRVLRPGGTLVNLDAAYGQEFIAADSRGEQPTHITQSPEQLRTRNRIAAGLAVSTVDRPSWDAATLLGLGVRHLIVDTDVDASLGIKVADQPYTQASGRSQAIPFGIVAVK